MKENAVMVTIRKVNINTDCEKIFEMIRSREEDLLPNQMKCFNVNEFYHWLLQQFSGLYHEMYVFAKKDAMKEIVGFVLTYDYRVYDGHCFLCTCFSEDIVQSGLENFIDLMFREYPLKKIFWELTVTSEHELSMASELGFTKELLLKEYKYQKGKYVDVCVLSVYSGNL